MNQPVVDAGAVEQRFDALLWRSRSYAELGQEARELSQNSRLSYAAARGLVNLIELSREQCGTLTRGLLERRHAGWLKNRVIAPIGSERYDDMIGSEVVRRGHDVAVDLLIVTFARGEQRAVIHHAPSLGLSKDLVGGLEAGWGPYAEAMDVAAGAAEAVLEAIESLADEWRRDEAWRRLVNREVDMVRAADGLMRARATLGDAAVACIEAAAPERDLTWAFAASIGGDLGTVFHHTGRLAVALLDTPYDRRELNDLVREHGNGSWRSWVPPLGDDYIEQRALLGRAQTSADIRAKRAVAPAAERFSGDPRSPGTRAPGLPSERS